MKCNIRDCENESWQGKFNGNLCEPCHKELLEVLEETAYSQARRNMIEEAKDYVRQSEHYKVDEEYA